MNKDIDDDSFIVDEDFDYCEVDDNFIKENFGIKVFNDIFINKKEDL